VHCPQTTMNLVSHSSRREHYRRIFVKSDMVWGWVEKCRHARKKKTG
jgi:hypothetical protein